MRSFLPFAALLGVALVLGCQEQGLVGPDGLSPQFAKPGACPDHPSCKGGEEEAATFTATFTGPDVTGEATPLFGPQSSKKRILSRGDHTLTFNDFLHSVDDGASCFPVGDFEALVSIGQDTPGSTDAQIQFHFAANGTEGTTGITYTLNLRGVLDPAEWVPEGEETATITGGTFEIAPTHGPGAISCKGTGSVDFTVEVVQNPA